LVEKEEGEGREGRGSVGFLAFGHGKGLFVLHPPQEKQREDHKGRVGSNNLLSHGMQLEWIHTLIHTEREREETHQLRGGGKGTKELFCENGSQTAQHLQ